MADPHNELVGKNPQTGKDPGRAGAISGLKFESPRGYKGASDKGQGIKGPVRK